ncbi:MAG TPA: hypothetical protein EYP05_02490 [Piscirickettsiaceae bacterium]|nr:hypothetical protein [Piscirickettsiaceae bacterium]HIQ40640.1 hypothetical protein [Sulfurivirga caldicuralii]
MSQFTIERSEIGYTVFRDDQAIATYSRAAEAIEAMRQFRERPSLDRALTIPPMFRQMKAGRHKSSS